MKCGKCKYYRSDDSSCRRMPPKSSYFWPFVSKDDWCGEYREYGRDPQVGSVRAIKTSGESKI